MSESDIRRCQMIVTCRVSQMELKELTKTFMMISNRIKLNHIFVIYTQLIQQQCAGDTALVEMLMNTLLTRLADPSHKVRMFCIRGLGNIASGGPEEVSSYSLLLPRIYKTLNQCVVNVGPAL